MWCLHSLPASTLASLHLPVPPYSSNNLPTPSLIFLPQFGPAQPMLAPKYPTCIQLAPAVGIASLQH